MKPATLRFDVITLFPEMIAAACSVGILGKAIRRGLLEVEPRQLRDYTGGSPHPVDDRPYGGGPGMVLRVEPIYAAVEDLCKGRRSPWLVLLSPQGRPFAQATARRLAGQRSILLLCARYEGVDERVRSLFDEEISIGDYVLSGGEPAAIVVIDAVGRLLPGVLGSADSVEAESFSTGVLEYPQYTRPESFRGMCVPSVLLSGNHGAIERWRREQALERTRQRRPDLLARLRSRQAEGSG